MRLPKLITTGIVGAAMCFGSTAAVANSCQGGSAGCLLPFQPAVSMPVVQGPVGQPVIVGEPIVESGGIGILPILLGLAALGGLAYLLLSNDDDEGPISV